MELIPPTPANRQIKIRLLWILSAVAAILIFFLPTLAQPQSFHHFADQRNWSGISNYLNVLSNIAFIPVGIAGWRYAGKKDISSRLRIIYRVLFVGIILTALGSAYYHLSPDNGRLVYDRLPMVIIFMAFLSVVIAEWISLTAGSRLLIPLLLAGICSVMWWQYTELHNAGDLRFYLFVQFYPMILIPLILLLFNKEGGIKGTKLLINVIAWYIIAKLFEHYDEEIYSKLIFVSGHTLKHLAAAVATWYMVLFFKARHLNTQ